jgi:hypothetical protein
MRARSVSSGTDVYRGTRLSLQFHTDTATLGVGVINNKLGGLMFFLQTGRQEEEVTGSFIHSSTQLFK